LIRCRTQHHIFIILDKHVRQVLLRELRQLELIASGFSIQLNIQEVARK
jgi:hypothetical protein